MKPTRLLPVFLLLMAMLAKQTAFAQPADLGNWFQYFGLNPVGKRMMIHNEIQYRNYNLAGDLQQLIFRAGIGYNLTEGNHNVLIGYGHVYSENYSGNDKVSVQERRPYAQFAFRHPAGKMVLGHRYRVEYRIFDLEDAWRLRYQLWFQAPLNKPSVGPGCLYLMLSDEIFLHTTQPQYDRNRLYGALGYVISPSISVELGMMRQSLASSSRNQLQIAVFNRMRWGGKIE